MKRKNKNILSIIILIVLCGSIIYTGYLCISSGSSKEIQNVSQNGGTPPDMPNGNSGNEPPAKPDGDTSSSPNNSSIDGNNQNDTSSGEKKDSSMQNPPDMPSENSKMQNNNTINSDDTICKIILGGECLLFSIVIIYLVMSKFNKKDIKETFKNNDKIVIYVLSVIVMTAGLGFVVDMVVDNLSVKTNNSQSIDQNQSSVSYSSSNEITESTTKDSGIYTSTKSDENALSVSGGVDVSLSNINVSKSGDSNGGDNTSFYGTNSALIAKSGASLTLKNITVKTNAVGANGVFSYGGSATTNNSSSDGTTVNISDSKITTTKDNSGGIMTTGGGVMNAKNLTIETSGISSAAIRTDRGGGTVTVDKGTYKTNGQGSPTIYSTADITVKNATLTANASEGVVIEGKNKVTLNNVELTDTNNKLNGKSTTYKNIFLYQSMSGDAASGVSEFTSIDSTITTNKGDTIYVTNTKSKITLTNNKITNNDKTGNFLRIQKDSWGNSGSNGGDVSLVMSNQKVKGNIVVDSISTLDMSISSTSYYEGSINNDNSAKEIKLSLDKSSKIKLTGDSYVTSFNNKDSSNSNIDFNGYKLYVNGKAIN